MTKAKKTWRLAKLPLAVSLASTLATPAFGVNFNIGEIEGQFDSSLSRALTKTSSVRTTVAMACRRPLMMVI
jgi:hypothetical protein